MSIFFLFQKISYGYLSLYKYIFNKSWSTASDFIRFWKCREVINCQSFKSFCWDCIKRPPFICDLFMKVPWRVAYDSLRNRNADTIHQKLKWTRQLVWYRSTATLRRQQIKQYTASNEGGYNALSKSTRHSAWPISFCPLKF